MHQTKILSELNNKLVKMDSFKQNKSHNNLLPKLNFEEL